MRLEPRRRAVALFAGVVVVGAVAAAGIGGWAPGVGGGGSGRLAPKAVPHASLSPASRPAPRIIGWITASGSGIRDSSGKAVRLTGVADGRMNQCKPSVPTHEQAATIERLGFNSVRLAISWAATEPTPPTPTGDGRWQHHWDGEYLGKVDQAVSVFKAHGLAVILDMHQVRLTSALGGNPCTNVSLPGWVFGGLQSRGEAVCSFFTNTRAPEAPLRPYDALSAVWQHYADRYADNSTVVAADLYNEPYVVDACPNVQRENLARFYGAVGTAVRKANTKIALVLEDVAYEAYERVGLQLTSLPPLSNVIYSWHFYPTSWESGRPRLAAHVARARDLRVPLWLGEFDGFGGASNTGRRKNPNWKADLAAMMAYCRENDIGWALWEYRGTGSSLLDPDSGGPKQPLTRHLQEGF